MSFETKAGRIQPDGSVTVDGLSLGEPGDGSGVVQLARLKIDEVVAADACEITAGGDVIVTVNGANYAVRPACIFDGARLDNAFLFIGFATTTAPAAD